MDTQLKPMSVEEWLYFDVPEGMRAELVDGAIEMTPLAATRHQRVLHKMIQQLAVFMIQNPGVLAAWYSPCRFSIPGPTPKGREPDLGLYDRDPDNLDDPLAWRGMLPIVVAEVVSADPGEAYRDYVEKRIDYHAAGIREYWLADFRKRLFSALRRTESGWEETLIEGEGRYSTPLLPGFELDTAKLWT
jgi:Uma2 family endonuclease